MHDMIVILYQDCIEANLSRLLVTQTIKVSNSYNKGKYRRLTSLIVVKTLSIVFCSLDACNFKILGFGVCKCICGEWYWVKKYHYPYFLNLHTEQTVSNAAV